MSKILVDTSVWIAYFKGDEKIKDLDREIDANRICVNELILSELLPAVKLKSENRLADLLESVNKLPLNIDWEEIREYQLINLRQGINKVGIPDLIILQNAVSSGVDLLTLDKHFIIMAKHIDFEINILDQFFNN